VKQPRIRTGKAKPNLRTSKPNLRTSGAKVRTSKPTRAQITRGNRIALAMVRGGT